jgi:hypothetical protein
MGLPKTTEDVEMNTTRDPAVKDLIENITSSKVRRSASGTTTPRGRKPRVSVHTNSSFKQKSDESSSGGQKKTTSSVKRGRKKKSTFSSAAGNDDYSVSDTCSLASHNSNSSKGSSISNGSKRI